MSIFIASLNEIVLVGISPSTKKGFLPSGTLCIISGVKSGVLHGKRLPPPSTSASTTCKLDHSSLIDSGDDVGFADQEGDEQEDDNDEEMDMDEMDEMEEEDATPLSSSDDLLTALHNFLQTADCSLVPYTDSLVAILQQAREQAAQALQKVGSDQQIATDASHEIARRIGDICYRLGDYEHAAKYFSMALSCHSNVNYVNAAERRLAYLGLGESYLAVGK
jgi:tetratricopeptide (TPR) repeat protein